MGNGPPIISDKRRCQTFNAEAVAVIRIDATTRYLIAGLPAVAEVDSMRSLKEQSTALFAPLLSLILCGCSRIGAPSFVLFGAFFPRLDVLRSLLGVLVAIVARIVFVATGLASILPYQLFVCLSVGLIFAFFAWLLWFG